jgi:hypothetical protein
MHLRSKPVFSFRLSLLNSPDTPNGQTIRNGLFSFIMHCLAISNCINVLPKPKLANMARLPPSKHNLAISDWCGNSFSLSFTFDLSNPKFSAIITLFFKKSSYSTLILGKCYVSQLTAIIPNRIKSRIVFFNTHGFNLSEEADVAT